MITIYDIFEKLDNECLQRKELAMRDYAQGIKDSRKGFYNEYFFNNREDNGAAYNFGWHAQK